jgi:hypothetical protein
MIEADLQRWQARQKRVSAKAQQNHQVHARRALRCNIARLLLHEDYRGFAARLADSPLLQYLLRGQRSGPRGRPQQKHPPTLLRLVARGGGAACDPKALGPGRPGPGGNWGWPGRWIWKTPFSTPPAWCANIHYPVDWVLLRDATRTLMRSVRLIRDQGLKHRMEEPEAFISRINKLCIKMTQVWRRKDPAESQRLRKQTLRQMDRLVGTVRHHARRYRQLLDKQWERTDWTRPQAEQVLGRMDQVLAQLPKARQQARQRILQGQLVANEDKILSLYEADVHVIVRKKAGAEVEFGNTLFLAENPQGVILDWELFRECPGRRGPVAAQCGAHAASLRAGPQSGRGRPGVRQRTQPLRPQGRADFQRGLPPCAPAAPAAEPLVEVQTPATAPGANRRPHRILKNVFLGGRMRCKGFAHRALTVTWTVLVHNLWVLARLQRRSGEANSTPWPTCLATLLTRRRAAPF